MEKAVTKEGTATRVAEIEAAATAEETATGAKEAGEAGKTESENSEAQSAMRCDEMWRDVGMGQNLWISIGASEAYKNFDPYVIAFAYGTNCWTSDYQLSSSFLR